MLHSYDFDDMARRAHRMAREKGWWGSDVSSPDNRAPADQVNNFHAELSEAWEEWRAQRGITEVYHRDDGKPEGFPVELADLLIRLGDTAGRYELVVNSIVRQYLPRMLDEADVMPALGRGFSAAETSGFVKSCHKTVTGFGDALEQLHGYAVVRPETRGASQGARDTELEAINSLALCVLTVLCFCERAEIPIAEIIEQKMVYNATRPHRHGGKRA